MQIQNQIPILNQIKGKGEFCLKSKTWNAEFYLILYPHNVRLVSFFKIDFNDALTNENWTLRGTLDDEREVYSNSLLLLNASEDGLEFQPLKEIRFGKVDNLSVSKATFPLIGFYGSAFEIMVDEWNIKFDQGDKALKNQKRLSKIWKIQLEGIKLQLYKENTTQSEYIQTAIQIADLLSLATGNEIIFNRQLFYSEENQLLEIWRTQQGDDFGVKATIPEFAIPKFLNLTYPIWKTLDSDDIKLINNAVNYINSTEYGYLEDRILRITQVWESVANKWIGDIMELPEELGSLKTRLKSILRDWRKEFPDYDKTGFLGNRISDALTWQKAVDKCKLLASKFELDLDKLNIDFKKLFQLRNEVAHTGKFKNKEDPSEIVKILENARFGLQILFLRKLNYTYLVSFSENGFNTIVKIGNFLSNEQNEINL